MRYFGLTCASLLLVANLLLAASLLLMGCTRPGLAKASAPTVESALAVRTSEGFVGLSPALDQTGPWLVPLTSRSERRILAATWMDEAEFLVVGTTQDNPLHVQAIAHPTGTEVLQDERGLWAVGEPLPWPAGVAYDPLPWIRRDGVGATAQALVLPPVQEGLAWVLVPLESDWRGPQTTRLITDRGPMDRPATRDGVWIVEPTQALAIELGGQELDALWLCQADRIPDQALSELTTQRVEGRDRRLPTSWEWKPFQGEGPALPHFRDRSPEPNGEAWADHAEVWRARLPLSAPEASQWTLVVSLALPLASKATAAPIEASAHLPKSGWLRDATRAAGLQTMHLEGPDLQLDIRPTMGPGAAFGDYDGDGWYDLYVVQGAGRKGWPAVSNHLFRNRHDGTFEDVTALAGVGDTGAGMGCLFFDADGDRDMDLYVANYGRDVLYQNQGDGTFVDVSEQAGLQLDLWSAAVSAADYDGDGDLDLYVTSYLDFDPSKMPPADELQRFQREDPIEMLPFAFPGQRNVLLRNESKDGEIAFVDVTEELGLANAAGLSMQSVWWDFDGDLDPDLYVANDVSPNVLFLNLGDGHFEDISFSSGLDDPRGGMGLDVADVDQDGDEDLFLANWQLESNALYLNQGSRRSATRTRRASFQDATVASGLGPAGVGVTSWGVAFLDLELDGNMDLFVANGYTSPDYTSTGICVGQPNQLFRGDGRGRFVEASAQAGPVLAVRRASRAAVPCDYDRDGDIDLVVTANNGWLQLLRNEAPRGDHRYVNLRLRDSGNNTEGIGARVTVQLGERRWVQSVRAGMGYLGGNAPELNFGLGSGEGPATVEVAWRSGAVTEVKLPALDCTYLLMSDGTLQLVSKAP